MRYVKTKRGWLPHVRGFTKKQCEADMIKLNPDKYTLEKIGPDEYVCVFSWEEI